MNIFPDFKQNDIEINAVRHLCFGSTGLSHVFFEKLSESTKTEILKYLRSHQLPSEYIPNDIFPTQNHLRWCIKCFEKDNEKSESEKDFENNLILYELLRTKTKQTINFYKALAAINETFNPQNFANLITSFFDFYHFNKSFATVFIPVVSKFAEKAGFSQVSNSFGKESLVLFHSGTLLDLTFSFQTQEDFEYVFQFPNLPNEVLVFFQTCFISDNAFPLTSFVSQTPMLSALNTCATTSAHFVEIISSLAESQFRARDYENCWKTCLTSEELAPWVFISLCKENNICESVKTFNNLKGDNIAYDLLRRAMADNHICEKYKHMTGNTLKPSALVTRSIPSLLEVSLDSFMTNDFNEMFNTQLFSIRDEDLSIDNDFVCYYFALGFTVKLLNNEISIDESSQIELFIANIRNDENRQKCLIDIFSLMFLQDKNKAFLCSLNSAECISMIILNSTDNQNLLNYVQIGHSRIQTEQFISEGGLLSKCFVNKMTQVNNALIIGDYQIAEHVAGHDMKLRAMIDAHRSVQNFRKQRMNGFDGKGLPAVEVGLSFEDEVISLQKSDGVPLCDECKQIIEKRIRMKGVNQLGITSRTDMQEFSQITQKLVRTSSVSWTTPSYSDTSAKLLYGFFSYLDSIIPPLLEAHIGQTVFDYLRVDRKYMIDKLL